MVGLLALCLSMGLVALRADRPFLDGLLLGLLWLMSQYAVAFPLLFPPVAMMLSSSSMRWASTRLLTGPTLAATCWPRPFGRYRWSPRLAGPFSGCWLRTFCWF